MAKYEDYVNKRKDAAGGLTNEIEDAAKAAQERNKQAESGAYQMPDRFKGKSPEEIAKSYEELAKAYSRQGNELGESRKTISQLVDVTQSSPASVQPDTSTQASSEPVTVDSIYEDPDGTVRRAAREEVQSTADTLEQRLAQTEASLLMAELSRKHPDWEEDVNSPEYQNWVHEKPYRQRMAATIVETNDFGLAEELLDLYAEHKGVQRKVTAEVDRQNALSNATLEGGAGDVSGGNTDETFSRSELAELRIRKAKGDPAC